MKNKIFILAFILLGFLANLFTSCGRKEHERISKLAADTVRLTVVKTDTLRDTVITTIEDEIFIDLNEGANRDILITLDENTPNNSEVLTFSNENINYSLTSGEGFSIVENKLIVTDDTFLDFETRGEIKLEIEIEGEDKSFDILVLLNDVVDIPELRTHFNFDQQNLMKKLFEYFLKMEL